MVRPRERLQARKSPKQTLNSAHCSCSYLSITINAQIIKVSYFLHNFTQLVDLSLPSS